MIKLNQNITRPLINGNYAHLSYLEQNEIIKEIPVLATSLKIIRGIKGIKEEAYRNKVKKFIDCLGKLDDIKKNRLIEESKKDLHRRCKIGNSLVSSIEQSESLVKIEYLAIAFKAFIHGDINDHEIKLIYHIIRNSFTEVLVDIIENDTPSFDLKYTVSSGLSYIELSNILSEKSNLDSFYRLSPATKLLKKAWKTYK